MTDRCTSATGRVCRVAGDDVVCVGGGSVGSVLHPVSGGGARGGAGQVGGWAGGGARVGGGGADRGAGVVVVGVGPDDRERVGAAAAGSGVAGRSRGSRCGGVRCDVVGAEVVVGAVGADRRRPVWRRRTMSPSGRWCGRSERFGSTTRVRSNGRRLHPDSQGLTMAAFRQTTSRLDDPQLHTHLVISAQGPDRRTVGGSRWTHGC